MKANPRYWGRKAGIQQVVMRTVPEPGTRVAALLAGDVDIITAVSPDDIERINASGRARALTLPGNRIAFYFIAVRKPPLNLERSGAGSPRRDAQRDRAGGLGDPHQLLRALTYA